jgi:hypothetical protein
MKLFTLLSAFVLLIGHAQAQSQFDFSFTGSAGTGAGETISGVITLNASQNAATNVLLTSLPANFDIDLPADYNWAAPSGYLDLNSFTVTDGNISAASFDWNGDIDANDDVFELSMNDTEDGQQIPGINQFLNLQYENGYVGNDNGLSGITFTPVAAPEPATLALAALGAGALLKLRRQK